MRLKDLITTEAKLQLYEASILPHLTCCHCSPGTSARQAIGESLSVYKEDLGQFLRINILAMRNYWQKQAYHHRCTTDNCKTLLSSCIRFS